MRITHEHYFRKYHLSVEQYGEILVKVAFRGKKMLDHQKGYDIAVHIGGKSNRIEVKSKLASTKKAGRANAAHWGPNKLEKGGMSHLAVILVSRRSRSDGGSVREAWLLSKEQARQLRNPHTKSKYINVNDLRAGLARWRQGTKRTLKIESITEELKRAARRCA